MGIFSSSLDDADDDAGFKTIVSTIQGGGNISA